MSVGWEVYWSFGKCKESWVGVTVVRKCVNYQGGVEVRQACQLTERYDSHGRNVRGLGEVCRFTGSVIVIR